MQESLMPNVANPGEAEAAVRETLSAWADEGHLSGAVWAAHRMVLVDLARAVDAAAMATAYGASGADGRLSRAAEKLGAALDRLGPRVAADSGEGGASDDLDTFLAALGSPSVGDPEDA